MLRALHKRRIDTNSNYV
uniref:Uncharacterized protein n=1 Tax=Amphimedon queenslandica TaxID=400682 RepID=A0A1X7TWP2_AMPQE